MKHCWKAFAEISKSTVVLLAVLLITVTKSNAQTVTIEGTGTTSSYLYSPIYSFNAAPRHLRIAYIYSQPLLSSMPATSLINKLQFSRNTTTGSLPAGNNLKLYLMNTATASWGTSALTWDISAATLVFDGDPSTIVGTTAGYKEFSLIAPFSYTGSNLAIFSEYTQTVAPSTTINWNYNTATTQPGYAANQTNYTVLSTGAFSATLSSTTANHPNIKIDYLPASACTTPPTSGTATSTFSNVCSGANFTLNLTGNSTGQGQTYQWQSSPTGSAPWTDIGSVALSPSLTTSQSATTYYRCGVTCSGNTQYSTNVQVTSPALVSGTFTINSGQPTAGSNFQTFTDAVNYIKCGINGPVTFNVLSGSGPYNEQVQIESIFGASATNTITINGNGATLSFGSLASTTTRHGIHLNGADYVRINNLIIDGTASTTAAWGIVLTSQADSNVVSNCTINIGNLTSTSTNFIGIALNGVATGTASSGNNGNNNQFLNNNINGGYYNYYLYGNSGSSAQNINNIIKGGTLQDAYTYGVYAIYQSTGLIVDSLDIWRPGRTVSTTAGGVFVTTGTVGALIQRNKIHNLFDLVTTPTSTTYGIYIGTDATTANPTKVLNNLIYNIGGNGTSYGIYNTGGDSMQVYHNTIALNDAVATTGTAYGIYQTTAATGIDVRNNIVTVSRSGTGIKRCLNFATATTTFVSNNNVFYMNAGAGTDNKIALFGATSYTTLAEWQASNSNAYDQLSYELDPTFANAGSGDFKPTNSVIDSKGTPVGVLKDIVDSTRSTSTPDIGAYEFSTITAGLNFGAIGLVTPAVSATGCYGTAETITLTIKNLSATTHNFVTNPVTVNVNVTGAVTQNFTTTINTGTLASETNLDVVLPGTLNMSTAGVYTFNAATVLTGDVNTSNDAILPATRTKVVLSAGTPTASPTVFCAGGGTLPTLTTSGLTGATGLQWQESNTSISGFSNITGATTSTYTINTVLLQNKYYRLVATCAGTSVNSGEDTVVLSNPTLLTTTPATRCGTGTVNLGASASSGANVNWYAAASGGSPLFTGNTFTTPSITSTTTYYASATTTPPGSTNASPLLITEIDLGTDDRFEIQNVSGAPLNLTGWRIALSNSYTDITSVNANIQALSGTMVSGETKVYTDATAGPNYWGSNILWNPGVYPSFTGWVMIIDNNNVLRDVVFFNWPSANIQAATFTIGTTPITVGSKWAGDGVNQTTVAGTQSISRKGSFDNDTKDDFEIVNLTLNTTNLGMSLPFSGFGCESARTAVVATVDNNPACGTLPVTLTNFKGEKASSINKLSWTTLTEVNNAGFELERSTDGINFSSIGFVASASLTGNSSSALNYNFNDAKGFAINSYYRLKQVDKDGKFTYSTIVLLKVNKVKELTVTSVYPNPANATVNIAIESPINDKVTLVVTDLTGKVVLQKIKAIATGNNIAELSINTLASGSYFVKLICENGCTTAPIRFVKQ